MNNTKTLQKHKLGLSGFLRNWAAALAVVLCLVIFTIARPTTFLTSDNIITILRSVSITCVLAMALLWAASIWLPAPLPLCPATSS